MEKKTIKHLAILFFLTVCVSSYGQRFADVPNSTTPYFFDKNGVLYTWNSSNPDPVIIVHPHGKKWIGIATDGSIYYSPFLPGGSVLLDVDSMLYIVANDSFKSFTPGGEAKWKEIAHNGTGTGLISSSGNLYIKGRLYYRDYSHCTRCFTTIDTFTLFPPPPDGSSWKKVSMGADHFLALSSKGDVYGFGNNAYGQYGCGDTNIYESPTKMRHPDIENGRWKSIAAGRESSFCIDQADRLYHSGTFAPIPKDDPKFDSIAIRTLPTLITNPRNEKWSEVRIGSDGQIVGLTEQGSLYTWGIMPQGVTPFRDSENGHVKFTEFIPEPREVPIQDSVMRWISIGVTVVGSYAADQACRVFGWGLRVQPSNSSIDTPTIVQRFCQTSYVRPSVNPNVKSTISELTINPNPASQGVRITFTLDENAEIRMELLDILGKQVRVFDRLHYEGGDQTIEFPLKNLSKGMYILRLQTTGGVASASLIIE